VDGTPFGRYRLVELLGRGGMGEVWRAFDTAIDRVVALKVLPANLAGDPVFQERFRREARAAAGLDEPHVVPIHDFGEIDGRLYVTMRLIKGRDLQTVLADGPIPPARAVRIIEQVAQAVHAAHKVGLVHRDIKPSNILLDDNDFAYLIDFGIARAAGDTGLTATGGMIGTVGYMAPERFSTGQADARSDIYALACVLYECLTGHRPFPGDTLEQQLAGHLATPPPRPSHTRPGVPAELDPVIATGMAKQPDARYPTPVQLARAARDAITTPLPRPGPTLPAQAPTEPASMPSPRPPRPPPAGLTTTQVGPLRGPPSGLHPDSAWQQLPPAQPPVDPLKPAQPPLPPGPPPAGRLKRWIVPAAAALAVISVLAGGFVVWQHMRPSTSARLPPPTTPRTSSTTALAIPVVDFHAWQPFGGIDAQVSGDGRSVVLDTHDTTQNWKTVWSGLIALRGRHNAVPTSWVEPAISPTVSVSQEVSA